MLMGADRAGAGVAAGAAARYLMGAIQGEKAGLAAAGVRGTLRAASWLYLGGLGATAFVHRAGIRTRARASCPVISVGNLSVGGTGKSTAVAAIARWLVDAGFRPAVLSRGYGSTSGGPVRIVSDGRRVLLTPDEGGDEPVMLARRLEGVPVLIGRCRPDSARAAVSEVGADVCLLDDGFQVQNLERDLDIVLLDGCRPFDNGFVLPRGMLREPPQHLRRADVVVLTDPQRCAGSSMAGLRERARTLAPGALMVEARRAPERLWSLPGERGLPMGRLQGLRVAALSAIGNPAGFEALLRELGADVVPMRFRDHHRYAARELRRALDAARDAGAAAVVTTDKDAVKLRSLFHAGPAWDVACRELEGMLPASRERTALVGMKGGSAGLRRHAEPDALLPMLPLPLWVLSIRLDFVSGAEELRQRVLSAAAERPSG